MWGIIKLFTVAALGVLLVGAAAIGILIAPAALHGQGVRERPFSEIRTQIIGGSEIGAALRDVDSADVAREKLKEQSGAVINRVESDGPAAAAGFRAGDVVLAFDGERVRGARHLSRLIEETPEGRTVLVGVVRGGQNVELKVTPEAARPWKALDDLRSFGFDWPGVIRLNRGPRPSEMPDLERNVVGPRFQDTFGSRAQLGVTLEPLTDQLREFFGASAGGVLVTTVDEDSAAARAGIKAGDVITAVNGRSARDAGAVAAAVRFGAEIELTIVRDRREQTITAAIPDRDASRAPRRIIR